MITVELNHECVFDLHTGKYMTDAIYHDVEASYKNGFVMHRLDDKYDVFDSNCKLIVDKLDWQDMCGPSLIKVRKNDMINIVNMATGKIIIPKWVSAKSQIQVVTLDDVNGTFKHQKPGIYITQQKFDEFGNISSFEQIYVDFNGKVQISEDNPFED